MAKKVWNNPIDKSVDWGGDETTGYAPVSGEMVQRFIKESFNQKAGIFYYDNANNRYLVFADADARDSFLLDPTQTSLIIGTFDAPFNYTAEINLTSAAYNAVFLGSTGNYIDFTFDVKNKQGASTGENVTVTYTFIRNAVRQTYTETKKFGDAVHFNVDKYLGEGTNTIMVGITGQTSLAATTVAITYQVVNLTLEDGLDISKSYNLANGSKLVEIPFTVSGYGTKIVEWYLDGELLPFIKAEDEVVDVIATRTKYITLSNLQQGTHSLQIRAYTVVNGEEFYTDTLYRDLIVYTGANNNVIIGVAVTIPREYGVLGVNDNVAIYNMVQYVPYTLRFATYSPTNASSTEVTISLDGIVNGTIGSMNGVENEFVLTSKTSGNKSLKLSTTNVSKEMQVVVKETDMNIQEINSGLVLDFNASGKSNNSSDRDSWSYGAYTGTLSGFNWNNASGWVNGRLEMNAGSSFAINLAPLAGNPTSTGKTIEIEWSTKNVTDDNAVICDLRGADGVGILITATKVSMTSADGVVVETEYKSDENVRIGFVINKASGTTNKRLSFIYANGIVSRAEQWAETDNYISNKTLRFEATSEAEVSLKAIRIYDAALSSDNMLNNYILYRDTIAEMMDVYDRNDVYEEGTVVFSPEKMMGRLPVMIVTGDIPTLENTSDKDTQIIVDIEYYNLQDSSKSFTMKNAAMRPQGTSSMGYPKKNFRIYTQKVANTEVYDASGKLIEDKLYSFKKGAQPVNCWCLKADYAESSGTHNTGIARLWNEALFNAMVTIDLGKNNEHNIDNKPILRTEAQKAAILAKYPYDVRTAIDGFPILLFYRPSVNDDLIFIGKYNFNNDKSTESVFGFKGIPNFDNSKMQCWEVLNNGNALALFTTVDGFDEDWSKAFESRYPDTKTPYTGDLKAFCEWMVNVSQKDFATQKWEHLNVYMMAAYWCYLMRHAAADQFVKNAMFTSEDGQRFYYILYDNDTINGLINTGHLRIKPTDDRNTVDESGSHVFAGYDSRLWNMLENDEEFISIVSAVDNALYSAGISYANTIKIFDKEQADKWVERVYNQDAQYKYVGPYVEKGIDNLFMLQGKRDLHRRWWLAKRFSIYDAKYVSGEYKSKNIELKCIDETPAGLKFKVTSGYPLDYGYGINNVPREFGVYLNNGESHTFETKEKVFRGDPIRIYGAPHLSEIDLSLMSDKLAVVTIGNVYDESLGTRLTKLVIGNANKVNVALAEISGLKQAASLEYLDIQGITKMNSVDLSNQKYFKTLKAKGSGISSVSFAKGAPVERIELPSSMRALALNQLSYLDSSNIVFESIASLQQINVSACPNVTDDFGFVYNWYTNKTSANATCSLIMDGVKWENVNPSQFLALCNLKLDGGEFSLKGRVSIPNGTLEVVNAIKQVFGETVFLPDSELYIEIPESLVLEGPSRIANNRSGTFVATPIPIASISAPTFFLKSGGKEVQSISGVATINATTGVLSVNTNLASDTNVVVGAKFMSRDGSYIYSNEIAVLAFVEVYPSSISILGDSKIYYKGYTYTYTLSVNPNNVNVSYGVSWSLPNNEYFKIASSDDTSCTLVVLKENASQDTAKSLSATLTTDDGEVTLTTTKTVTLAKVVRPTSLVFGSANGEVRFVGEYTYTVTPNVAPSNVSLTYQTPTLSGNAVTQGKVSLGSASNGTIVVKVDAESTTDITFTINQKATISEGGAVIEGSKQVTLKSVIRPTGVTLSGATQIVGGNTETYVATVAPSNVNVDLAYRWVYLSDNGTMTYEGNTCTITTTPTETETSALVQCIVNDGIKDYSAVLMVKITSRPNFITAKYNVTSTSSATKLMNNTSSVTYMEIDGTEVTPTTSYTFGTTGEHVVKVTITNMHNAWSSVVTLVSLDFSECNGVLFSTFYATFNGCKALTSIEWGECTFPNVTNLQYAFNSCSSLTSIDLNPFKGVNVTNLQQAFSNCSSLTSIDLSPFKGAPITSFNSTFSGCKALTSIEWGECTFPNATNLNYAFSNCSSLTSIDLSPFKGAPITSFNFCFRYCSKLTSIEWGECTFPNVTSLQYAFSNCSSLTSIDLSPFKGAPIASWDSTFSVCLALQTIICPWVVAPTVSLSTFGDSSSRYTGRNSYSSGTNKLYAPAGATGYNTSYWLDPLQNASKCGFTLEYTYEPTECTSLVITADDVNGRATSTTIHYTAITNGIDGFTGETITGVELKGKATSEEFPQNTSTTDTVEREISFTYMGITATTTITQGVWPSQDYTLDLNDGEWALSDTIANPDPTLYDGVYQSVKSKGVNYGYDTMYIDIVGYETFKLYIRSYAESNYDYVMVSQLDMFIDGSTSYADATIVKAHTRGNQQSGTAIGNYTLVEFTGIDKGTHCIIVIYTKDSGGNNGDDRGYVLIPKEQ